VGMDAGYFTLVSLLFSAISISISNIFRYYFYTSTYLLHTLTKLDLYMCDFINCIKCNCIIFTVY